MEWISVGRAADFAIGIRRTTVDGKPVLVANLDGSLFAFDPHCPHAGGPLMQAEISGQTVSCPLHGWTFDLARRGCESHGFRGVRTYATRVEDGILEINFSPNVDGLARAPDW